MSGSDSRLQPAPDATAFDYALAIAKAGSIAFPFLGAGVTLFDLVTAPLRGKRLNDWCEELRLRLNELAERVDGLTPEAMATNEAFVSAFAQATQAALKTHDTEKLEALRNAVLNVAAGSAPGEDLQSIFLNLIDSLTPLHLHLLTQFRLQVPVKILEAPSWLKEDVCSQAAKELLDRGLLGGTSRLIVPNRDQLILGENGAYTFHAGPTPFGNQFLLFIAKPEVKK